MRNKSTLQIVVLILTALALVVLTALAAFAVFVLGPSLMPTLVPLLPTVTLIPAAPTPTPELIPGSISGRVWHDLCIAETGGAGCVPASGDSYRANGVLEDGEPGLGGALVQLAAGECPATGAPPPSVATTVAGLDGNYMFGNLSAGAYCVFIDTARAENAPMLPGTWTAPIVEAGNSLARQTVMLPDGQAQGMVNFGWDYALLPAAVAVSTPLPQPSPSATPQPSPSATPQPSPSATPQPSPEACTNRGVFIQDVTIPDYASLSPGQSFVKIWRLRNTGTCTWGPGYALVFAGGDDMGGSASTLLSGVVEPGETADLSIILVAPAGTGVYQGKWQLRTADGLTFGLGKNAASFFWVRITVGLTPTASPSPTPGTGWRGEYYGNRDLAGAAALVQNDADVNFNWGLGSPTAALPVDGFSARWSRSLFFQAGDYRFSAFSDDGVRVWLDGQLIIDQWRDATDVTQTSVRTLGADTHSLRVEYYENIGTASVRFWWEKVSSYSDWRGEYWSNTSLSGNSTLVRNDVTLDFYWGRNAPATELPADKFSARWSTQVTFASGRYRFIARVDDGVRVFIDGNLVINEWHANDGKRDYSADVSLTGSHQVVVEYYEDAWDAWITFWWERIGD